MEERAIPKCEIAAGGIVYRKQEEQIEILLIEDHYGRWTLPKGKKEDGETDEENALREIKEETGIDGKIIEELLTIEYQYDHPTHGTINKRVVYYLVEAVGGSATPQLEEILNAAWFTADAAYKLQQEKGYENNHAVFCTAFNKLNHIPE
ncbi:uncharacterized protein VTP21DRAFT_1753 [Calcarisporiella thermophila]|uniref:uncharacterized protein n=1 Tax=Calcarisporiella thermophila TaxID=911321 RepID=UPI003743B17D